MFPTLLTLLNTLTRSGNHGNSVVGGARQRICEALANLHSSEKTVESNEQLLVNATSIVSLSFLCFIVLLINTVKKY